MKLPATRSVSVLPKNGIDFSQTCLDSAQCFWHHYCTLVFQAGGAFMFLFHSSRYAIFLLSVWIVIGCGKENPPAQTPQAAPPQQSQPQPAPQPPPAPPAQPAPQPQQNNGYYPQGGGPGNVQWGGPYRNGDVNWGYNGGQVNWCGPRRCGQVNW